MIQRLQIEQVATFQASPQKITFAFPPVPQGLTWTGNVSFSVAVGQGPDLQGIVWTAYRNGAPVLTWQEFGIACDLQVVSHEILTVVGVYMGSTATLPVFEIHATWSGYSADASEATPVAPSVAGSNRGLIQVYNSGGMDAPLEVVPAPIGSEAEFTLTAAGTSGVIMAVPTAPHTYSVWDVALQITAASLSTDTGAKWLTGTISVYPTGKVLLQGQVSTVPGSADSCYLTLPMHGLTLAQGQTLQVAAGAFTGANANVCASAVYVQN